MIGRFTKQEFLDEYGDLERWEKAPRERRQDEDGDWFDFEIITTNRLLAC